MGVLQYRRTQAYLHFGRSRSLIGTFLSSNGVRKLRKVHSLASSSLESEERSIFANRWRLPLSSASTI